MCLQLADQSVRYPEGVAENISVRVWDFLIPEDFVVLDMALDTKTPLILGRPFLSTAKASIDVGVGQVHLNINGKTESFTFQPKVEQCNQVTTTRRNAPQKAPQPSVTPDSQKPKTDSLIAFMQKFLSEEEARSNKEKALRHKEENKKRAAESWPLAQEREAKLPISRSASSITGNPRAGNPRFGATKETNRRQHLQRQSTLRESPGIEMPASVGKLTVIPFIFRMIYFLTTARLLYAFTLVFSIIFIPYAFVYI